MTEWIKLGVIGNLHPIMQKAHGKIVRLFANKGLDFYTTSIEESNHTPGSFHYIGLAEDALLQSVNISEIKALLGPNFDVIKYKTHFHYEYDPKE